MELGLKTFVFLSASMLFSGCNQAAASGGSISIEGSDEVVVSAEQFACSKPEVKGDGAAAADVPDAPPRFFRRMSGDIMMVAAHHNNIPWYTTDLKKFERRGCGSILRSNVNPDPAAFDDQVWIVGFYTKNGKDVFALAHNEYHGAAHIPQCAKRLGKGENYWAPICLQISMKGYVSHDQGANFSPSPAAGEVLATTKDVITPQNYGTAVRFGIHDPSNIVRNPADGGFYFISNVDPSSVQRSGICLFKSEDPLNKPWLAWDGKDFTARMSSPYRGGVGASCAPVRPWGLYIPALSYNTVLKKFIGIGRSDAHKLVAVTSRDLIHWDEPQVLRDSEQLNWWRPLSGMPAPDSYWTIVDPTTKSPFFDTSGSSPYVYYVSWRTTMLKPLSRVRDIKRFKLSIVEERK
jgi:hypothetical protein